MAAEDDEIDILGDFSLDGCLNKSERAINSTYSELLKCDYSVHPQWLLDTATTACWYDNPPQEDGNLKSDVSSNPTDNLSDEECHPSTSHVSSDWTVYERELLKKGMEIYGRDNNRLSVFLGSKTPQEVQLFVATEYGIHLDLEPTDTGTPHQMSSDDPNTGSDEVVYGEILTDNEIPASIEEVIGMVSTAVPTVPNFKTKKNIAKSVSQSNPRSVLRKTFLSDQNSNRSLLKKSNNQTMKAVSPNAIMKGENSFQSPPKLTSNSRDRKASDSEINKYYDRNPFSSDIMDKKFYLEANRVSKSKKSTLLINSEKTKKRLKSNDFNCLDTLMEKSKFNISLTMNKKDAFNQLLNKKKQRSINSVKKKSSKQCLAADTSQATTFMQIVTGSGQALPLSKGEQVIKIEKNTNSDADSDIDIDVDSDGDGPLPVKPVKEEDKYFKTECISSSGDRTIPNSDHKDSVSAIKEEVNIKEILASVKVEETVVKPLVIPESLKNLVLSLETPTKEYVVNPVEITDLEKFMCPDFFEGRPAKTPDRYVLIRSHLITSWSQCRPQYLTKTSARHGLRNCGDVNCIGRIHSLLEQLGAINFGCEQTSYIRPLSMLLTRNTPTSSSNPSSASSVKAKITEDNIKIDFSRQRKKKIVVDGDGGYTITHGEFGEIHEVVAEPKQQRTVKKKPTNLIYCRSFSQDHPAPYRVTISLSALILMDFHAHTSRAEVMGLLGGKYDQDNQTVSITTYVPCDSLDNSGTHCDMCPVSQSAGTQWLWSHGLEPLGWHHSHPLFPPWPSAQDLASQGDMQGALGPTPFLAVILSPHWQPGRTSSQYRCLYVKTDPSSDQYLAFRFKTVLEGDLNSQESVDLLMENIRKIIDKNKTLSGSFIVNMKNDICPNAKMTYLDKCISSISYHLRFCENKMDISWCKNIIQRIHHLVR